MQCLASFGSDGSVYALDDDGAWGRKEVVGKAPETPTAGWFLVSRVIFQP